MEISNLLNTGLDSESLSICVKLIEAGVNPEALAMVIKELRRESAAIQVPVTISIFKVTGAFDSTEKQQLKPSGP